MEVTYEVREGAAWIRLRRPEALNALTPSSVELLAEYAGLAAEDPDVRSVIITGTGRAFCAGADLREMVATAGEARRLAVTAFVRRTSEVFSLIEHLPKPVVAAVNGLTVAGGLELVLCCDMVIAVQGATLSDGHARFGLVPGAGATARLPRAVGNSWAKYLMLTGRRLSAEEAQRIGLVNVLCADDALEDEALRMARDLAAVSPLCGSIVKNLANHATGRRLEEALQAEFDALVEYSGSSEMAEGLLAFNEKREPAFDGRAMGWPT